jgi:hypothetical protein
LTEYSDFVHADFNDAFAFYVNGINRALICLPSLQPSQPHWAG